MKYEALLVAIATTLGVVYFILALAAASHAKPEKKGKFASASLWLDPWWPYYGEDYLPSAKRLLWLGRVVFPIAVALWVLWASGIGT